MRSVNIFLIVHVRKGVLSGLDGSPGLRPQHSAFKGQCFEGSTWLNTRALGQGKEDQGMALFAN